MNDSCESYYTALVIQNRASSNELQFIFLIPLRVRWMEIRNCFWVIWVLFR
jgi:hypothetical protein